MFEYPELAESRLALETQDEIFKPSSFWENASAEIVEELYREGIEKFRSLPLPLSFFAPTYGSPGGGFSQEQVKGLKNWLLENHPNAKKPQLGLGLFLDGLTQALSDYRVLKASDDIRSLPELHQFSESKEGDPIEHFEFEGRWFSRSSLNYLLGLAFLKKHLNGDVPRVVLEIGGGFGSLGEVLASSNIEGLKYIDVDIPPTSYIAQYYLSQVLGEENVSSYHKTKDLKIIKIEDLPQASVFCSWQIEMLQGSVDLFVNFISFQEMEPTIVQNYCNHVSRLNAKWVLLRNMREGKQIKTNENPVGVKTPIKSDDYNSMLPNYELVDSSIIPYGYETVDEFNSELLLFKRKAKT
ncbi:putative sugar O-methyltransferase [Cognaticolwellia mytili]|uniref:putative sugar O-methyltransferase n=1 Tax=Cognaticolwellia mytili TaxID=1888913 RepID=UPI000A17669F|nr:putative sugar O-methyltransferase [Cognaticolwellia mytili]